MYHVRSMCASLEVSSKEAISYLLCFQVRKLLRVSSLTSPRFSFVQITCGNKSLRSPQVDFIQSPRGEQYFDVTFGDWFAIFSEWKNHKRLTLQLFAHSSSESTEKAEDDMKASVLVGQAFIPLNRKVLAFNGHEKERQYKLCYAGKMSTFLSRGVCKVAIGLVFTAQMPVSPAGSGVAVKGECCLTDSSTSPLSSSASNFEQGGHQGPCHFSECPAITKLSRQLSRGSSQVELNRSFRKFFKTYVEAIPWKDFLRFVKGLGCSLSRAEWKVVSKTIGVKKGTLSLSGARRFAEFAITRANALSRNNSDDSALSDFEAGQTIESNYLGGERFYKGVIERKES